MMYKILCLLILGMLFSCNISDSKPKLENYSYIPQRSVENEYNGNDIMYDSDLNRVEMYLFRKIYPKQPTDTRMARIERAIYGRTYPSMNKTERMNNILSCYQDTFNMKNYVTNYYSSNPLSRIWNNFNGYPTGFTPPIPHNIMNNPRFTGYGDMYYGNRGYRYNNVMPPTIGTSVHILD